MDEVTIQIRNHLSISTSKLICSFRDQHGNVNEREKFLKSSTQSNVSTTNAPTPQDVSGTDPNAMDIDQARRYCQRYCSGGVGTNTTVAEAAMGYFGNTAWLDLTDSTIDCFVCRAPIDPSGKPCISGGCVCRLQQRRPMHTACLSSMMEFALDARRTDPSSNKAFVHICGHCQTPLLGDYADVATRASHRYARFCGMSQEMQRRVWPDECSEILKDLESVVSSIWNNWRTNDKTCNPYLALQLAKLATVNTHVTSLAHPSVSLCSVAGRFAVFCYLKSYEQIGTCRGFELTGVAWLLERSKLYTVAYSASTMPTSVAGDTTKTHPYAQFVMPHVSAYLLVVMKYAKDFGLRLQAQQVYLNMLEHIGEVDTELTDAVVEKFRIFLLLANYFSDNFDATLPAMTVCNELMQWVIEHKSGGNEEKYNALCRKLNTHDEVVHRAARASPKSKNRKKLDAMEGKITATTPTTPAPLLCSTCGTPETTDRILRSCKQCHTTQYCNTTCQRQHWRFGGHNKQCKKECKKQQKAK